MFKFFERQMHQSNTLKMVHPSGLGKIPNYDGFFRHNMRQHEAVAFEHWLQEGVGCIARRYPKNSPGFFRTFPCHHYISTGSDQEHGLLGTLIGSQDKSGRAYPFALISLINNGVFQNHRASMAMVYGNRLIQNEKLMESLADQSFQELVNKLELQSFLDQPVEARSILKEQIKLLKGIPASHYWNMLDIPFSDDLKERFIFTFFDFLETVVKRGVSKCLWGIRIPLPACEDPSPFVVFWVQMIEAILEDRFWRANYFWNRKAPEFSSCLTLFFRELPPSYLPPLLNQQAKDNMIYDVLDEAQEIPNFVSRSDLRRLLNENDPSLLDLLYRLGRREMIQ